MTGNRSDAWIGNADALIKSNRHLSNNEEFIAGAFWVSEARSKLGSVV